MRCAPPSSTCSGSGAAEAARDDRPRGLPPLSGREAAGVEQVPALRWRSRPKRSMTQRRTSRDSSDEEGDGGDKQVLAVAGRGNPRRGALGAAHGCGSGDWLHSPQSQRHHGPGATGRHRDGAGSCRRASSDCRDRRAGRFAFTALPSGTYDVAFTLPGFLAVAREGVIVAAGATVALHVEMSLQLEERGVVVSSRRQPRS